MYHEPMEHLPMKMTTSHKNILILGGGDGYIAKEVFITQAGSPYYATKAFYYIDKTLRAENFKTLPMQNQVLTLGQWGWILAKKQAVQSKEVTKLKFTNINLKWLTEKTTSQLVAFGKPLADTTGIKINTIFPPKLYSY